jgi:uncharacterized membrane protein (DUF2068 family)
MSDEQKNLALMGPEPKPKGAPTVYFIAAIKLFKGLAALLLALGVYTLPNDNVADDFHKLLVFLHIDPEKRFFQDLGDRLSDVTASHWHSVALVSTIYGLFMLLQAVGLAFRFNWAVWLVILESGFFIPIEVFELIRKHVPNPDHPQLLAHPKMGVLVVLLVNVAIFWYLFENRGRIVKHYHHQH